MSSLKVGWWRFLGGSANLGPTCHVFFLLDNVLMARLGRAGRLCHDWLFLTQVDTQDRNEPLSFIPDQRKELRILCKKFSELLMLQCSDCSILIVWIFRRCFDREVLLRTKFGSFYLCGFHFQREKESSACIRFLLPADCNDKSWKFFEKPSNPSFALSCSWRWFLTKICIRELVTGCHWAKL